mgnify:CR=1 FL=1
MTPAHIELRGSFFMALEATKSKFVIKRGLPIKVISAGHYLELRNADHMNWQQVIKKLSKKEYVVLSTGEIKKFQNKAVTRLDNTVKMRQTFNELRYLINANFFGKQNELWVTLTYKENMIDPKILSDDFKKFMKNLNYKIFHSRQNNLDYIMVPEPQGRGAWHAHVLIKRRDEKKFFIQNKLLAEIWGHGFVKVNRIQNSDNVGLYLTAYLGDLPLADAKKMNYKIEKESIKEVKVDGENKKFVKGARLVLYPAGMKYYRTSRGLTQPKKWYDTKKEMDIEPRFVREHEIEIDEFKNHFREEQYNLLDRKKLH